MTKFSIFIVIVLTFYSCKNTTEIVLSKYPNGQLHEVLILNNPVTKDSIGIKKIFFVSGKLQCSGPVSKGNRNGLWTCFYPNDSIEWRANYKMEVEEGEVFCGNKDGTWRKMTVVDGVREGKITEYSYDNKTKEYFFIHGQYSNNLEQGLWTKTSASGILLIEMTFLNGERIGYFTNRYKNGQIRLKGELQKDGSMKNFTFYDETGKQTKRESYTIEQI